MKALRHCFLVVFATAILISGCTSMSSHNPLPHDFDGIANPLGMPVNERFWGDEVPPWYDGWHTTSREDLLSEFSGIMGRGHNYQMAKLGFPRHKAPPGFE